MGGGTILGTEETLGEMAQGFADGIVVPFLGAGVNACERPPEFKWKFGTSYLPVGPELSLYLAEIAGYPDNGRNERTNLLRVAQYLSIKEGPAKVRDAIRKILIRNYQPTAVHRFFAGLPKLLKEKNYGHEVDGFQLLIVTTNYDDLLERAFRDAGVEFDVLVYRADASRGWFWHIKPDGKVMKIEEPNKYTDLSLEVRPVIVKIHGAVNRGNRLDDSYVISEDDYIDYLAGADLTNFLPVLIKKELIASRFLFMGYSLQDWNLRVFLKKIWEDQQKYTYKSWAIQLDPQDIDKEMWQSRRVEIIGVSLDEFMKDLQAHMDALPTLPPPTNA